MLRENLIIKIEDIKPYVSNARTHSPEQISQISASIREFGFTNPILIDEENNLIAGHGRILGAAEGGMNEVPAVRLSGLTQAQRRALVIADNKLALNAGWDYKLLTIELADLIDAKFDMGLTGFTLPELTELFPKVESIPLPVLNSDPNHDSQDMTFKLSNDEAEAVKAALDRARQLAPLPEGNRNSMALMRIIELFMGHTLDD